VPDISFPAVDLEKAASEINNALKDAAYVAVGLGVLAFQRAQVRRVELAKQLEGLPDYLSEARDRAQTARAQFASEFADLSRSVEDAVEALEPLRAQLLELAKQLDEAVAPARQQLDEQIDRFEQSLPDRPRSVVRSVRSTAASQEQAWRRATGLN